jgi:hypothetical protein
VSAIKSSKGSTPLLSYMQVNWLLEKDTFDEGLEPLKNAIKKQGHNYIEVGYVPFESGTYDQFEDEDCVICYGSLNLMRHLRRIKKWVPGPIMDLPNLECTKYYTYFGKYLINSDYTMMPLNEMLRRRFELLKQFDGQFFVRPSTGFKSFTGQVVNGDKWDEDVEWIKEWGSQSEIVVVSSAKNVSTELRFVVADHKIIAGSQYKLNGELEVLSWEHVACGRDYYNCAAEIASDKWEPDRAYTIDIASVVNKDGLVSYGLMEINSFSASGMYACDWAAIVKAANEIAVDEWEKAWK